MEENTQGQAAALTAQEPTEPQSLDLGAVTAAALTSSMAIHETPLTFVQPTIGRVVHYWDQAHGPEPSPAVITGLEWLDTQTEPAVWLTVLPKGNAPYPLSQYAQRSEGPKQGCWSWAPMVFVSSHPG